MILRQIIALVLIGFFPFTLQAKSRGAELVQAVKRGNAEAVRVLLDTGIDPNSKADNHTAVMYAALGGNASIVENLIEVGADVNARAKNGRTALMYAALGGNPVVVDILLKAGADVDAKARDGRWERLGSRGGRWGATTPRPQSSA